MADYESVSGSNYAEDFTINMYKNLRWQYQRNDDTVAEGISLLQVPFVLGLRGVPTIRGRTIAYSGSAER